MGHDTQSTQQAQNKKHNSIIHVTYSHEDNPMRPSSLSLQWLHGDMLAMGSQLHIYIYIYIYIYILYIYIYVTGRATLMTPGKDKTRVCLWIYTLNLFIEHSGEH